MNIIILKLILLRNTINRLIPIICLTPIRWTLAIFFQTVHLTPTIPTTTFPTTKIIIKPITTTWWIYNIVSDFDCLGWIWWCFCLWYWYWWWWWWLVLVFGAVFGVFGVFGLLLVLGVFVGVVVRGITWLLLFCFWFGLLLVIVTIFIDIVWDVDIGVVLVIGTFVLEMWVIFFL